MTVVEVITDLCPAGRVVVRDDILDRFGLPREPDVSPCVSPCVDPDEAIEPRRLVYAAAHVVMQASYRDVEHSVARPGAADEVAAHIDWPATMALRRHLDGLGFGIAEAMDTAQRFHLGWTGARKLIEMCGALSLANGFIAGAGTDHLEAVADVESLVAGVVFQAELIRAVGGDVILLPMPDLPRFNADADGYVDVYRAILAAIEGPVYIHWLGAMFMPALRGYFPGDSFLRVMRLDPRKVRGAKLSLLDPAREVALRDHLRAADQIMLTGDDFHFASLLAGDGAAPTGRTMVGGREVPTGAFSHALLGIFDGIARPASLALQFLARGDVSTFRAIMDPCEVLSRVVFGEPTCFYKSGLAFLSWLDGHQDNRMLVNHEETARAPGHFLRVAELASRCGVFRDAERGAARLRQFLDQVEA